MKQGDLRTSTLVLLPVLLFLLISGVSAGIVLNPSKSAGKYASRTYRHSTNWDVQQYIQN